MMTEPEFQEQQGKIKCHKLTNHVVDLNTLLETHIFIPTETQGHWFRESTCPFGGGIFPMESDLEPFLIL